ncbi:MAG: NAD(P)-binding domain-containing protein, partial [Moraxellaceae bacterium]|nr:NAD(P)-binding domain-containing protein [Moraxellaceae bacterium]
MSSTLMSDQHLQVTDSSNAVCIIGAGPAGLSVARAFKRLGIAYEQFERHSDVGGIWDLNIAGTPMYHSAHFISSRNTSGFYGFPMPDDYPDYPSNRQILAYTRSFARAFGLYDAIQFQTAIEHVEKDGKAWLVRFSGGEVRRYRAVVCATGTNWHPRLPRHEGQFNGEIRHSVTFKHADEFRNKRVLIIGLGNSGADIACDAAANADAAFISVRRGYYFLPKHVFGIPVDEFAAKGPRLPMWLQRPAMTMLLRMVVGDTSRTGMPKPDHRIFESHPLLNSQLLHYLQHGDIKAKKDVKYFDGDDVVFTDGSREQIDLVLYATGYN